MTRAACGRAWLKGFSWALLNAVQAVYTSAWSVLWISLALLMLVVTFGRRVPLAMARKCWAPGLLWGAGAKLEAHGAERIDARQSYVFVANHSSIMDIPVLFAALPVNVRFVLKRNLAWVPFIGWYAWAMGMIFVDRHDRPKAIAVLGRAAGTIRPGASVVAFPEGTRSPGGKVLPFKKGAIMLALGAGVPIVPVALSGTRAVLPPGGFRVRPGTIKVAVGEPIFTAVSGPDQSDVVSETVRLSLKELLDGIE